MLPGIERDAPATPIDRRNARCYQGDPLRLVKRSGAQLGMALLLFAKQKAFRQRRTLIGDMRLVANERDRFLVSLGTQGRGDLEAALPSANDDDAHLLLRGRCENHQLVERHRDV